jgi:hypothetical protein
MFRSLLCSVVLLGATTALRAGELDNDAPKGKPIPATPASAAKAGELDSESPTTAHRRGGWGYGGGYRGGFSVGFGYGVGYYGGYHSVGYFGGFRPYYGYSYYYSPAYYYSPYVTVGYYPACYCW